MIDYNQIREKYKPATIKTLLIAEAPPPNGKNFFYIPKSLSLSKPIREDRSLPATIFYHYFKRLPENINEYEFLLKSLQEQGIFLIDIIDEPLKIRGNKENEVYLIDKIPNLIDKIKNLAINVSEENWIFLLARNSYKKHIKNQYPAAKRISWIDFRLNSL